MGAIYLNSEKLRADTDSQQNRLLQSETTCPLTPPRNPEITSDNALQLDLSLGSSAQSVQQHPF